MQRIINWFEIPATDFERACAFYERVFAITLRREKTPGMTMGVFPHTDPATGGAVSCGEQLKPGANGIVIYLDGGDDLAVPLARAEAAGAKVLLPKMQIDPEIGSIALFLDSEGNRIGLHSPR